MFCRLGSSEYALPFAISAVNVETTSNTNASLCRLGPFKQGMPFTTLRRPSEHNFQSNWIHVNGPKEMNLVKSLLSCSIVSTNHKENRSESILNIFTPNLIAQWFTQNPSWYQCHFEISLGSLKLGRIVARNRLLSLLVWIPSLKVQKFSEERVHPCTDKQFLSF